MVHPHQQADQAFFLDRLRREADMAISRALREYLSLDVVTKADAIERLNWAAGVLLNDVAVYRRRLLADIASGPRPVRHLRAVPTSAADTAVAAGWSAPTRSNGPEAS